MEGKEDVLLQTELLTLLYVRLVQVRTMPEHIQPTMLRTVSQSDRLHPELSFAAIFQTWKRQFLSQMPVILIPDILLLLKIQRKSTAVPLLIQLHKRLADCCLQASILIQFQLPDFRQNCEMLTSTLKPEGMQMPCLSIPV